MDAQLKPTELATAKVLYDDVKVKSQTIEEIYSVHKRLLLSRARMVKIIDHLADIGLVRCRADARTLLIEAVK